MTDKYQKRVRKWLNGVLTVTGLTPSELARNAGMSTTTLTRFLNSDDHQFTLSGKTITKIADATGIPFEGDAPAALPPRVRGKVDEFISVPIFDIRASAGAGALVEDGEPSAWQPYRANEIGRWNIDDLAVIQVGGDSMWETLHDGDKVLVNRGERRIVKPGIYIIAYEGQLLVKRCQRNLNDGSVLVSSDNKAYDSFVVSEPGQLDVIGRVVWIGRALG